MFGGGVWGSDIPKCGMNESQTLNPVPFGGRFGEATGDALRLKHT
jgi:hypothetical protein